MVIKRYWLKSEMQLHMKETRNTEPELQSWQQCEQEKERETLNDDALNVSPRKTFFPYSILNY